MIEKSQMNSMPQCQKLWLKLSLIITALLAMGSLGTPAYAESLPLKTGTYSCWTLATMYKAPPGPDEPSEINRRAAGNDIRPMVAPGLLLAPAAFGNVILDGKGRYTMPTVNQSGSYGFDKAKGLPTFTGDLGAMQLMEYSGTGTSFVVRWDTMSFQCAVRDNAPAKPPAAVAVGSKIPNAAFVSAVGSKLSSAKASDFDGHYEGSYMCASTDTAMQLDLQAKADGSITGIFKFGGSIMPEIKYSIGSYSMKGTWQGTHFLLKGDQWIEQPSGYVMVDLEGDLTTLGTSGTVLFSICDSFAAWRVQN